MQGKLGKHQALGKEGSLKERLLGYSPPGPGKLEAYLPTLCRRGKESWKGPSACILQHLCEQKSYFSLHTSPYSALTPSGRGIFAYLKVGSWPYSWV